MILSAWFSALNGYQAVMSEGASETQAQSDLLSSANIPCLQGYKLDAKSATVRPFFFQQLNLHKVDIGPLFLMSGPIRLDVKLVLHVGFSAHMGICRPISEQHSSDITQPTKSAQFMIVPQVFVGIGIHSDSDIKATSQ